MGDISSRDLIGMIKVDPLPVLPRYLKWEEFVVADVTKDCRVVFRDLGNSTLSSIMKLIKGDKADWTVEEFKYFLSDRVPSDKRRDIDKILNRAGIVRYNVFRLANITRGFSAKDLLWLSNGTEEKMEEVIPQIFTSVFMRGLDFEGSEVYSPEGQNIKRYAVSNEHYGILKKRLAPIMTDVESEVAVYNLSKLMGVPCCPSWLQQRDGEVYSFSAFQYNFAKEFIVPFRRLFEAEEMTDNLYQDLITKMPQMKSDIERMILLDFVTRQDDRHLSNYAIMVSGDKLSFYPMFDNGRSLFYEDHPNTIRQAVDDISSYSTSFGSFGTYYDAVCEIAETVSISSLVNLNISREDIETEYSNAGLEGSKLYGAVSWTVGSLEILRDLDKPRSTKI